MWSLEDASKIIGLAAIGETANVTITPRPSLVVDAIEFHAKCLWCKSELEPALEIDVDLVRHAAVYAVGLRLSLRGWLAQHATHRCQLNASEAVYGLLGWLSTSDAVTILCKHSDASEVANLAMRFCEANALAPTRFGWSNVLRHPYDPSHEEIARRHQKAAEARSAEWSAQLRAKVQAGEEAAKARDRDQVVVDNGDDEYSW